MNTVMQVNTNDKTLKNTTKIWNYIYVCLNMSYKDAHGKRMEEKVSKY